MMDCDDVSRSVFDKESRRRRGVAGRDRVSCASPLLSVAVCITVLLTAARIQSVEHVVGASGASREVS